MPINASNAVTLAHQVRTYTLEAAGFTDTVDVFYVSQMMDKFHNYLDQSREVSKVPSFQQVTDILTNLLRPSLRVIKP